MHTLSALLVWGVLHRCILRLPRYAAQFRRAADGLASCASRLLLFAVHPLQIDAVEYVTQRTELMMGFFYLATLYCSQKYWTATAGSAHHNTNFSLAWLACLLGMACKEVMVTAPVVVLLYERTFLRGSFLVALRASWPLYLGFLPAWSLLLGINLSGPVDGISWLRRGPAGLRVVVHTGEGFADVSQARLLAGALIDSSRDAVHHHHFIDASPYLLVVTILALLAVGLCWWRSVSALRWPG